MAAWHLKTTHTYHKNICIHSDSQATLLALTKRTITSKQIKETIQVLNELAIDNQVTLSWVKAHVGHEGNEKADKLAKEGAASSEPIPHNTPATSSTIIRSMLRGKVIEYWNEWWHARPPHRYRQTKHFFPDINPKNSFKLCSGKRKRFSALIQWVTGHNHLRYHSSLVNNNPSEAECRYCHNGRESTFHILAECDNFATLRFSIFGNDRLFLPLDVNIKTMNQFLKEAKLESFTQYLLPSHED